ncbi:hypothetical protein LCGC14_0146180 [marine sediment metagenome]|uniref:Uncharacterized protein n=1 Tax=marine sediment metagenome TaxID=412755 RepID=A0A0F9VFD7_9ZZZZ
MIYVITWDELNECPQVGRKDGAIHLTHVSAPGFGDVGKELAMLEVGKLIEFADSTAECGYFLDGKQVYPEATLKIKIDQFDAYVAERHRIIQEIDSTCSFCDGPASLLKKSETGEDIPVCYACNVLGPPGKKYDPTERLEFKGKKG